MLTNLGALSIDHEPGKFMDEEAVVVPLPFL
jgi:hypothetical protein